MLTRAARPLPATLEWIHLSRFLASRGELFSAACSGFMEHSSKEAGAVRSWHDMLVDKELLSAEANAAIFGHFETDLAFDHAENWKLAVRLHGPVTPSLAAELLNAVTAVAEVIYRWLSALRDGLASSIIHGMQLLGEAGAQTANFSSSSPYHVEAFNGLPVWPSGMLKLMNYGDGSSASASSIVSAISYAFGKHAAPLAGAASPLAALLQKNIERLVPPMEIDLGSADSLEQVAASWLPAIDGHNLWERMVEAPSLELVTGYVLENFHYLASATRHITAAIAACTDADIRTQLLEHLKDELLHCDILRTRLVEISGIPNPDAMRPLPTTIAFVGFLQTIARQDWKAYVMVSAFLQKSLSECRTNGRHHEFYQRVIANCGMPGELLETIWHHDDIDEGLGHDQRPSQRLDALVQGGGLTMDSLAHAALAPVLAWSFLDGIVSHYGAGVGTVNQRLGWTP